LDCADSSWLHEGHSSTLTGARAATYPANEASPYPSLTVLVVLAVVAFALGAYAIPRTD